MGLAGRKPILPAPTESLVDDSTAEEPVVEPEVPEEGATDLSQRSDRTHHTIPEDGSPITISTKKPTSKLSKITKTTQNSQTSLLIEYFEGGKGSDPNRRPSVRVKVVPSSKNKTKDNPESHLVLTEATNTAGRRRSTTSRFSLSSSNPPFVPADSDVSVLESLHVPDPRKSAPLDIEIQQHSDHSEMSTSPEARYIVASSDISSMPADSMLGVQQSTLFAPRVLEASSISSLPAEDSILSGPELKESAGLKPPVVPRERNLSNERLTQKVIEKLNNRPRGEVKITHGQSSKTSSRSGSRDVVPASYNRAATEPKSFRETDSTLSPTEPSLLSNSVLSARSPDSARSAISNNSINNPKLLQTVEDAIRRLILPELKELKKDQRQQTRPNHDKTYSDLSESSIVREKSARRSVFGDKPRRRRSSRDHAETSTSRRRRSNHHHHDDYDSLSDSSSRREASVSSLSAEDPKKVSKSRRNRDLTAAGLAGAGLTAAALKSRDSEESLHKKRRRKRSKSRSSRSASVAESEEVFQKHKVPPMPMQSDLGSEITRSSILSSNTATSQTPTQPEVKHVARGAPRELLSPASNTPPRHSSDLRQTLGLHHGNFSEHNLSSQKLAYDEKEEHTAESDHYHSFSAEDLLEDPERMRQYERNLHTQHPIRRGLSPIQSVASYQTNDHNRNSLMRRSVDSLASTKQRQQQLKEEVSISSFTSASPHPKKTPRPQGISLENRSEIMGQHDAQSIRSPEFQSVGIHDRFIEDDHDHYRDSYAASEQSVDNKRLSGLTDASSDVQYVDKVVAGQNVVPVRGARPEIVPVPFGVESGVASLVEPSVLSTRESQPSYKGSFVQERHSTHSLPRDMVGARMASPVKDHLSVKSQASIQQPQYAHQVNFSPPQSPAHSYEEQQEDYIGQTPRIHSSRSPLPQENLDKGSPQSEITTNPSVIQGPIGGLGAHTDPWMGDVATPTGGLSRDFSSGAIDLIPEGLNVSQRHTYDAKPKTYVIGSSAAAPLALKDEGYATGEGDHYPSPASITKAGPTAMTAYEFNHELDAGADDPFTSKKNQYISGLSQATGKGVERIQSKDIIHLMEHLTVRDAQRNARDTEILFTLVRSAAEMRESFEEMKNFITDQDAMIVKTADDQHAQTQRIVGGPRQMPTGARTTRTLTPQDDLPTKRRNVFKRALQGLGSKNSTELQNIESMLMQLLDEVEALRSQQASQPLLSQTRTDSLASEDAARPPTDTGYEPEGRAGTASSGGERSLYHSNNSSRQGQFSAARRMPENRVSTVMEGDEDNYNYERTERVSDHQRTPRAASPSNDYYRRGQSEPLHTPPRMHDAEEITPTTYNSTDKKHKTFSSILPNKFVSRWSKTTTSTDPDFRHSGQDKPRPYSQVSRSGSNIQEYTYENNPDDRFRSATSLPDDRYRPEQGDENRPPSPLVPSAISDNPKYQAHRNSQNLQHPQPRQGPTGRYQYTLENAARSYHNDGQAGGAVSPISQISSHQRWETTNQQQSQQIHIPRTLSPISDGGSFQDRPGSASTSSITRRTRGPPRPPKMSDRESDLNEPLVPQRPPKLPMSPSTYVDDVRAARAGSPIYDKSPAAALRSPGGDNIGRKPSGPRPLSSSSNKETQKRARFVDSPVQSVGSNGNLRY
ncbi:hypothetical protein LTR64_001365 [Lithohypha guttulata]|uniref:uncharacterized protein n=1 Tax=Lithohypha guttulata TaxID=1690604 RepID=UPI002DDE5F65|nr:hypothetical protein LTR51_003559 [Lithohypha guttulata]